MGLENINNHLNAALSVENSTDPVQNGSLQLDWIAFDIALPYNEGLYWVKLANEEEPIKAFYSHSSQQFIDADTSEILSQVVAWAVYQKEDTQTSKSCSSDCITALSQEVHCEIQVKGHIKHTKFRSQICEKAKEIGLTGWVKYIGSNKLLIRAHGKRFQLYSLRDFIEQGNEKTIIEKCAYYEIETTEKETNFTLRKKKLYRHKTNKVLNLLNNIKQLFHKSKDNN